MSDDKPSSILSLDGISSAKPAVAKVHEYEFVLPSNDPQRLLQMCLVEGRHPIANTPIVQFGYIPQVGFLAFETANRFQEQQERIDTLTAQCEGQQKKLGELCAQVERLEEQLTQKEGI